MTGFDSATLAGDFTDALAAFATNYGPIVGLVIVGALGLYGVKLGWGLLTTYIRARRTA